MPRRRMSLKLPPKRFAPRPDRAAIVALSKTSKDGFRRSRRRGSIKVLPPTQDEITFRVDQRNRVRSFRKLHHGSWRKDNTVDAYRSRSFQRIGTGDENLELLPGHRLRNAE